MDFIEYNNQAMRTVNPTLNWNELLLNASLGLCGESGEVADHVKKNAFHGHALNDQAIMKELGDILFYLNLAADLLGYSLEEIAIANIEKLQKRYPNGFTSEASIKRKD